MDITITIGLILIVGYFLGKLANLIGLPKVSGYIVAGIVLNPNINFLIDKSFPETTSSITDICLAFITMEVGSTLSFSKIKKLGKGIISITVFEALFAFIFVLIGLVLITPYLELGSFSLMLVPFCILVASLASPTDPSSTLAVAHEFSAKGEVSDTIMGVAAFDDAFGILIYSLASGIAVLFMGHGGGINLIEILGHVLKAIGGAFLVGGLFGVIFNLFTKYLKIEGDAVFIILILGCLNMCFGVAAFFEFEELMATMIFGAVVVNFNSKHKEIFGVLERYTEELIFIFFFTLSGMHLDFSVLSSAVWLILIFIIFRTLGKFTGVWLGATITNMPSKIKKYTTGGLIPQGGIVVGLALMMQKNEVYEDIAPLIIGTIMGATIVHELVGPLIAKLTLKNAGEIN